MNCIKLQSVLNCSSEEIRQTYRWLLPAIEEIFCPSLDSAATHIFNRFTAVVWPLLLDMVRRIKNYPTIAIVGMLF
jgi:hypothetical protein